MVHQIPTWMAWHARFMVVAWSVLLPLGILVARFLKVTPSQQWPTQLDNKAWWHAHLALQYSGLAMATLAFLIVRPHAQALTSIARIHGALGWAVLSIGWLQILEGWFRGSKGGPFKGDPSAPGSIIRGDHYDMSPRRVAFEYAHKLGGYLVLLCAVMAIWTGLTVADAPRWMRLALILIWITWLMIFLRLQRLGWCLDTYQAIWGTGIEHPGNRRRPIGWGVRRATGYPLNSR